MPFNSATFLVFFSILYPLYLLLRSHGRAQNLLLLVGSYVFYGFFQPAFVALLIVSTMVDYFLASAMGRAESGTVDGARRRKRLVVTSVVFNLAVLGVFKYFNFFAENVAAVLRALGMTADAFTLNVLLPLGISFYTFQKLSYTIDVYRGKVSPTTNPVDLALFVAYFPHVAAGPIERASHFLPQLARARHVTAGQVEAGLFLILWGFFKKVVVADNVALLVNAVFDQPGGQGSVNVAVAVVAFAVQVYGDFSGYTDIARGLSMLLGFDPTLNFKLPYFARSIPEFWKRWHISLSNWLTDYVYTPLTKTTLIPLHWYYKLLVSLLLTFLISGLWHGANWTFVVWGGLHGVYMMCSVTFQAHRRRWVRWLRLDRWPAGHQALQTVFTFALVCVTYIFFRANSLGDATTLCLALIDPSHLTSEGARQALATLLFFGVPVIVIDSYQHSTRDLLSVPKLPGAVRLPVYTALLAGILIFGVTESMQFIYFRF
jgi:alginate O-acetyltransferase complex protein AlgI